jgi:hypothetical protein
MSSTARALNFQALLTYVHQGDYGNPDLISQLHGGANMMLAYFHYCNKGQRPFASDLDSEEFAMAELNQEQISFIRATAREIKNRRKSNECFASHKSHTADLTMNFPEAQIKVSRENRNFGDELYFISQLFEENWKPMASL